jgi:aldehyde:ferredoxin oxidoreductase
MVYWAMSQRDPDTGHHPQNLTYFPKRPRRPYLKELGLKYFNNDQAYLYETDDVVDKDGKVTEAGVPNWEAKGKMAAFCDKQSMLQDSVTTCDYNQFYYSYSTEDGMGDYEYHRKQFNNVTGLNYSQEEMMKAGERCRTLERAISCREGRTRADDKYFDYWMDAPDRIGNTADHDKFDGAITEYYEEMGYNVVNGRPTRARLEALDMKDVADGLEKEGKLG